MGAERGARGQVDTGGGGRRDEWGQRGALVSLILLQAVSWLGSEF